MQTSHQPITFTPKDGERVSYSYDDAMVIIVDIDDFIVKRILIDSENSYNVLIRKVVIGLRVNLAKQKK